MNKACAKDRHSAPQRAEMAKGFQAIQSIARTMLQDTPYPGGPWASVVLSTTSKRGPIAFPARSALSLPCGPIPCVAAGPGWVLCIPWGDAGVGVRQMFLWRCGILRWAQSAAQGLPGTRQGQALRDTVLASASRCCRAGGVGCCPILAGSLQQHFDAVPRIVAELGFSLASRSPVCSQCVNLPFAEGAQPPGALSGSAPFIRSLRRGRQGLPRNRLCVTLM